MKTTRIAGVEIVRMGRPTIAVLLACALIAAFSSGATAGAAEPVDWSMAGANPQRTSWGAEEITGNVSPMWYRPIEPYISQNVTLVAADGLIYVATAKGLYALKADSGDVAWVYATELPLGQAPTIAGGVAYVGGFDRRLHAIDAGTGQKLWTFDEAQAGYRTSPVVTGGKVFIGSRDGWMYAVGAHGTAQAGKLVWKYQAGGPILYSAAVDDGKVYFAAQDSRAYAVEADTGQEVWKSEKLPTAGFQSWWPVVWRAKGMVVFVGSVPNYRGGRPGTDNAGGGDYTNDIERKSVYQGVRHGQLIGQAGQAPGDWADGTATLDMAKAIAYLQEFPHRRTVFVLDAKTGKEFTFDHNGKPAYAPILYWGTKNGNRYPPVVGPDGVLYIPSNFTASDHICRGQVVGWTLGSQHVSMPSGRKTNAVDEPLGASGGGNTIYWTLCGDREAGMFGIVPGTRSAQYYSYNMPRLIPNYDEMWAAVGDQDGTGNRLWGAYGSNNGIYHSQTNDQNPLVPHAGKLFVHRSNSVIALAPRGQRNRLDLATIQTPADTTVVVRGEQWLKERLAAEVRKMLDAGHLRTGYFNGGQYTNRPIWGDNLNDYHSQPGQTLWALARALPHLPPELQQQAKPYMQKEFQDYPPHQVAHVGWQGAAREYWDLPPEVESAMRQTGPSNRSAGNFYGFPPQAAYAMWKYAEVFGGAEPLLEQARRVVGGNPPADRTLNEFCYLANAYIAGYAGYLGLEKMAGRPESADIKAQLDRLLKLRADNFSKDTPWTFTNRGSHIKRMSVFRNYLFITPELAEYLRANALEKVKASLDEIERVAPYWFVTHYEGCLQESTIQNLNDYGCVFQAHAWILKQPRAELDKYLDVPAWAVGDLDYIHQLVSLLEAP